MGVLGQSRETPLKVSGAYLMMVSALGKNITMLVVFWVNAFQMFYLIVERDVRLDTKGGY